MSRIVKNIDVTSIFISEGLQVPSHVVLPPTAIAGSLAYLSTTGQLFYWNGSQWISLISGGTYTLNSVGGGISVVNNGGSGPAFTIKSLTSSPNISLTDNGTSINIAGAYSLNSASSTVNDTQLVPSGSQSGPNFTVKSLREGTGISLDDSNPGYVIIASSAGSYTLDSVGTGASLVTSPSSGPAFTIRSLLTFGTGLSVNSSGNQTTITTTILDSVPPRNWSAGSNSGCQIGVSDSVAVGDFSVVNGAQGSVALGASSIAGTSPPFTTNFSTAIGFRAKALTTRSIVVGANRTVEGIDTIFIGSQDTEASFFGTNTVYIGSGDFNVGGNQIVCIGSLSGAGNQATAIGYSSFAAIGCIVIGNSAQSFIGSLDSISIGNNSQISAVSNNSIVLGSGSSVSGTKSIAIGNNIINSLSNTGLIGSSDADADQFVLYSTGYFRSTKPLAAKYGSGFGVALVTQSIPVSVSSQLVNFPTSYYDYYPTSYGSALNGTTGVYLGGTDTDVGQIYNISFNCICDPTLASDPFYFEILYTPPSGSAFVIARVTAPGPTAGWNQATGVCVTTTQCITGTGIRPFVQVTIMNQTSSAITINDRSLTVSRVV